MKLDQVYVINILDFFLEAARFDFLNNILKALTWFLFFLSPLEQQIIFIFLPDVDQYVGEHFEKLLVDKLNLVSPEYDERLFDVLHNHFKLAFLVYQALEVVDRHAVKLLQNAKDVGHAKNEHEKCRILLLEYIKILVFLG